MRPAALRSLLPSRGRCWCACFGLLASLLAAVTASAQPAAGTPQIYTCVDAQGRKLTSDRPIRACLDREQKILNPSGTVKGTLGPVLTAQERSEQEARAKAELAERARLDEEKRRDRALLARYPNPQAHQKERSEALAHIERVRQSAIARVTQLLLDKTRLGDEMAFYEKDPTKAPAKLRRQLEELNDAMAAQGRFLAEQDSEIRRTNDRFDEELRRLEPMWRLLSAKPP